MSDPRFGPQFGAKLLHLSSRAARWRCSRMDFCGDSFWAYFLTFALAGILAWIPVEYLQHCTAECKECLSHLTTTSLEAVTNVPLLKGLACSERKFCESNDPEDRPPDAESDYRKFAKTRCGMLKYISVCDHNWDPIQLGFATVAFACFNGMLVALLAFIPPLWEIPHADSVSAYCDAARNGFRLLTGVLLVKDLFLEHGRWHEWMRSPLRIQGKILDIVMLVSFQFKGSQTNHPRKGYEHRQSLHTWFRHFLSIQVFVFYKKIPELDMELDKFLDSLCADGLLEKGERDRYRTDKAVYKLVADLDIKWQSLPDGRQAWQDRHQFTVELADLRSEIAALGDQPVLQMPGAQPGWCSDYGLLHHVQHHEHALFAQAALHTSCLGQCSKSGLLNQATVEVLWW